MLGSRDIRRANRALFSTFWLLDHCLGPDRVRRAFSGTRARLEHAIRSDLEAKGPGRIRPIDRRRDLSASDFVSEYLMPNIPVVLEGAAEGWGCLGWTPETLAERYADDEVILINASPEDVQSPDFRPGHTTIGEVVASMREGTLDYARFNPLLQNHPELLEDLDRDWLRGLANRVRTGISYQLFMGGRGTTTAIHSAVSNNLFVQVYGEKRWLVFPPTYNPVFDPPILRAPYFFSQVTPEAPDLERHPLFAHVDGYEVHLKPGDVLFNPSFYWHWVTNLTDSIGVGFRWFAPYNIARSSMTQLLLTALSTNPPVWVARRHRQNFSRIFAETRSPS